MKKLVLFVFTVLLTLGMNSIAEEADPTVYTCGDYEYILLEDGTAEITGWTGSAEKLEIPAQLDGYPVISIGDGAFEYCSSLTSVTIPDGVISIGDRAFDDCTALTSITIPDSVTSIGEWAFWGCDTLTSIKISPEHPSFTVIDDVLFDKSGTVLLCYPKGLNAASYSIPQGTRCIGKAAFGDCSSLTNIIIPDSVTSIEDRAFSNCESLVYIELPDSVAYIGANPFIECYNLESIILSPEHPHLVVIDGALYHKADKRLVCYYDQYSSICCIPFGVQIIGERAFHCIEYLEEVIIPDSVTCIKKAAFYECVHLRSIVIPNSVNSIEPWAFAYCDNLFVCALPNGLTRIEDYAFYQCSLRYICIPDSVASIDKWAFTACDSNEVLIPDSVTNIGTGAFAYFFGSNFIVSQGSYAEQYCKDMDLFYTYPDSNNWLLN